MLQGAFDISSLHQVPWVRQLNTTILQYTCICEWVCECVCVCVKWQGHAKYSKRIRHFINHRSYNLAPFRICKHLIIIFHIFVPLYTKCILHHRFDTTSMISKFNRKVHVSVCMYLCKYINRKINSDLYYSIKALGETPFYGWDSWIFFYVPANKGIVVSQLNL